MKYAPLQQNKQDLGGVKQCEEPVIFCAAVFAGE